MQEKDRNVCFHCGGQLIWESDFNLDEVTEPIDLEGNELEGIVHFLHCADCGADVQYTISWKKGEEDDQDN